MATSPKLRQHTFDHLQHLIRKIKHSALIRNDAATSGDADLLDALLVQFVEEYVLNGSICIEPREVSAHPRP